MGTLGDCLREVADRLTAEREIQIKATARILGAAAQIAQNHDRLISEVSEMVQEDLAVWEVERLKREFGTLKAACAHFGKTARRWQDLAAQLEPPRALAPESPPDLAAQVARLQTQVQQLEDQVTTLQRALDRLQNLVVPVSSQPGFQDGAAGSSTKGRRGRGTR